jgi:hypothetical protein
VKRRRIEEQYSDYARRVVPKDAEAVQRSETRQAFFAGAVAALVLMERAANDKVQAMHIMADLMAEFDAFAEEAVRRGGRDA